MAIFHFSVKIIARKGGRGAVASAAYRSGSRLRSAVAAAAYRSASRLHDQEQDRAHDFSKKGHVLHAEIMLPDGAPAQLSDRETLWNEIERTEKRKDAQLAREVEVSLPRELSDAQNIALVKDFAREHFVSKGMIADVCVHRPAARDGMDQPHAHIMLTMREVGPEGFGKKQRDWNDRALIGQWREAWAEHANAELDRAGRRERVDHRTLAAQRDEALARGQMDRAMALDREPEGKIGAVALRMERQGHAPDRVQHHDRIRQGERSKEAQKPEREPGFLDALRDYAKRGRERLERAAERLADWWHGRERTNASPNPMTQERTRETSQPERETARMTPAAEIGNEIAKGSRAWEAKEPRSRQYDQREHEAALQRAVETMKRLQQRSRASFLERG